MPHLSVNGIPWWLSRRLPPPPPLVWPRALRRQSIIRRWRLPLRRPSLRHRQLPKTSLPTRRHWSMHLAALSRIESRSRQFAHPPPASGSRGRLSPSDTASWARVTGPFCQNWSSCSCRTPRPDIFLATRSRVSRRSCQPHRQRTSQHHGRNAALLRQRTRIRSCYHRLRSSWICSQLPSSCKRTCKRSSRRSIHRCLGSPRPSRIWSQKPSTHCKRFHVG
mmetsp:Transcript_4479/g.10894  ORF Transcript_4479/g.10894 Transcript_4479/m.10894 type:complete len:221 (-) Transcript_4479:66-728(-)